MIFNNLIKERRDKKINTLPKEIQRKLKRFEELDSSDYQLQVIKPSNELPKEGDIFVLSPKKGYYFLGKVMESNIESSNSLMSGSHVVVIFSTCFNTLDIEIFKPNYHELLTDPFIVSNQYWEKGYFYVIKHSPLSEEEKKLEIGFYKIHPLGDSFCTSSGERLEHEPQILGMYGLCTITGVAAEINRSLIMNPSIIANFL